MEVKLESSIYLLFLCSFFFFIFLFIFFFTFSFCLPLFLFLFIFLLLSSFMSVRGLNYEVFLSQITLETLSSLSLFLYFLFLFIFILLLSFIFSFSFLLILFLSLYLYYSLFPLCLYIGLIINFFLLVYSRTIVQLDMLATIIINKISKFYFSFSFLSSISSYYFSHFFSTLSLKFFFLSCFISFCVFIFLLLGSLVSVHVLNCKSFLFEATFMQLCN